MAGTRERGRRPTARGGPEEGSAAITGFAVAVAIYAIAFTLFVTQIQGPIGQHIEAPQLTSRANGGIDTLLNSVGQLSANSPKAQSKWTEDPDNITRLGLIADGRPGHLDLDKMRNLTKGNLSKASNALLDYDEARSALGLGLFDLHLRSYPLLSTLEEGAIHPVKNMDVAYIGDYENSGGGGGWPVQNTSLVYDGSGFVFVNVTITNNGTDDAVFQVEFKVPLKVKDIIDTQNTGLLGPGQAETVSLKLYKLSSWKWKSNTDKNVYVTISDLSQNVGEFKVAVAPDMTDGTAPYAAIKVSPGSARYKTTDTQRIYYDIFDGDGKGLNNVAVNWTVKDGATTERSWQGDTGGNGYQTLSPALGAATYDLHINLTTDSSFTSDDKILVSNDDIEDYPGVSGNYVPTGASNAEAALLDDLVENFTNALFSSDGDIYPDVKRYMNRDLANNISAGTAYEAVVVGSNVDHNAMTSESAKNSIRDFVHRGGLLVVLGSDAQRVSWLEPLFHSSLTTAGDGISSPDPTHPVLHTPQELSWQTYEDNGRSWKFNNDGDASHFTHIIVREDAGGPADVVSVSKPGHFGNGTVVLTGWRLYALTDPQDDHQAKSVLYNFLLQALGQLFVDFGPRIPDHAEVASATRMATAPHPAVPGEQVLVRMVLYVFR